MPACLSCDEWTAPSPNPSPLQGEGESEADAARDASGNVAQGGGVPQTAYSPTRLTFPDARRYSASAAA